MQATSIGITDEFVDRLAERAREAEDLRRLPDATRRGPGRVGVHRTPGSQALRRPAGRLPRDPRSRPPDGPRLHVQRLDHRLLRPAQLDARAVRRAGPGGGVRARVRSWPPPRSRRRAAACPVDGGIRLTGRWSWATGVMAGNWLIVGALCGPDDGIYPALALLPAADFTIEDVWHTDGMRATGSNDVVVTDVFVPEHRLVQRRSTSTAVPRLARACTTRRPTAGRWCPPWPCWPRCPHSAAPNGSPSSTPNGWPGACSPTRASCRRTSPSRRPTSARRAVRLRALRGLLADTVGDDRGHRRRRRLGAAAGARRRPDWPPRTSCTSPAP